MNCLEAQRLVQTYADGELDILKSVEMEAHMRECQTCARAHAAQLSLRSAVVRPELYFAAPAGLRERIRASLREESESEGEETETRATPNLSGLQTPNELRRRRPASEARMRWLAVAASLAFLLLVGAVAWRALTNPGTSAGDDMIAREVTSSHIRSLMANHLTDVASTDQHTVKPWFDGKLDFAPRVADFAAQGFPLVGGRLDYIGGRGVAALVYQRNKHLINLFIWPAAAATGEKVEPRVVTRQGYNLVNWTDGAMTYWAVSDLNEGELREFAALVRGR